MRPLEAASGPGVVSPRLVRLVQVYGDAALLTLIVLNIGATIAGTVPSVQAALGRELDWFETFSVAVFTVEYVVRFVAARHKLRHVLAPLSIIDLAAVLPYYLPFLGLDLRFARAFRLLRLLRAAKLARYVRALHVFGDVARAKREELIIAASVMMVLLVCASSLMYYAEHDVQPQQFSSIPATMWWSVSTLTTVGYGDVYPITPAGKVIAGLVAVLGVGFFALPTAILGAGFVEVVTRRRLPATCPHCGGHL